LGGQRKIARNMDRSILAQSTPLAGDYRLQTLMLQCSRCATIFSSGIHVSDGKSITFKGGFHIQCPRCGSLESIPDVTIKATVEGIAKLLLKSQNPLQEVGNILSALQDGSRQGSISPLQSQPWYLPYKKWLPDSPKKLSYYAVIFAAIYQILSKDPAQKIEYSPTFIESYNQAIVYPQPVCSMTPEEARKERRPDKGFGQYERKNSQ